MTEARQNRLGGEELGAQSRRKVSTKSAFTIAGAPEKAANPASNSPDSDSIVHTFSRSNAWLGNAAERLTQRVESDGEKAAGDGVSEEERMDWVENRKSNPKWLLSTYVVIFILSCAGLIWCLKPLLGW